MSIADRKKGTILKRGIKKMSGIRTFLDEVARSRDEFDKKIDLVISRFDTLKRGYEELEENVAEVMMTLHRENNWNASWNRRRWGA